MPRKKRASLSSLFRLDNRYHSDNIFYENVETTAYADFVLVLQKTKALKSFVFNLLEASLLVLRKGRALKRCFKFAYPCTPSIALRLATLDSFRL